MPLIIALRLGFRGLVIYPYKRNTYMVDQAYRLAKGSTRYREGNVEKVFYSSSKTDY